MSPNLEGRSQDVQMEIKGLLLDPSSNVPIVILRDLEGTLFLPIWIGVFEANAIAMRLEKASTPRPLTHDLIGSLLERCGATLDRIVISDLQESTFFATLYLVQGGEELALDARPSDAIALALGAEAPIYVTREVLTKAQAVDLATQVSDEEAARKWLEDLDPEQLGKYTM
jgi:uncharacterized protein